MAVKTIGYEFNGLEFESREDAIKERDSIIRKLFDEDYVKWLDGLDESKYFFNYNRSFGGVYTFVTLKDAMGTLRTGGGGVVYNDVYRLDIPWCSMDNSKKAMWAVHLFYLAFSNILVENDVRGEEVICKVKLKQNCYGDVMFEVNCKDYLKWVNSPIIVYNVDKSIASVYGDSNWVNIDDSLWEDFVDYVNDTYEFDDYLEISICMRVSIMGGIKELDKFNVSRYQDELKKYTKEAVKTGGFAVKRLTEHIGKSEDVEEDTGTVVCNLFRVKDKKAEFILGKGSCGINLEMGSVIETGKYVVFDGGFVKIGHPMGGGDIDVGLVEPIKNIRDEVTGYGLRIYQGVYYGVNMSSIADLYYNFISDTYDGCMDYIRSLDGKSPSEKNYFMNAVHDTKYYRYCNLIGVRDFRFSTYMSFDSGVCAYLKYTGKLKVVKVKKGYKQSDLIENLKMAVKIPIIRKLFVKIDYVFNIYETLGSTAYVGVNQKYTGKRVDLDEFLKESKGSFMKELTFIVSCINKNTNNIEQRLTIRNGEIIGVDGCSIEF